MVVSILGAVSSNGYMIASRGLGGTPSEEPNEKVNDPVWVNKLARRLMRRYVSDKLSTAADLVYSSKEAGLLKKTFPDADNVVVYLLIAKSEIEIRIFENGHVVNYKKYQMDEKTLKCAKQAVKRDQMDKRDDTGCVVVALFGMLAITMTMPWLGVWIYENMPRHRRIKKQYEEFKSSLPNYDDSIRMATTPEEFARFKNLKEFNDQRLANYWTELQNSK